MIAGSAPSYLALRWLGAVVWRSDAKIAAKLMDFAAAEAGSALDMLKAAELTEHARLRRLFFRHALDEARHARLFRAAAHSLRGDASGLASEYQRIHATRQNLCERLGLLRFVAFVYLAEQRGEVQFRALEAHFANRPEYRELFARIGKDERFHVAYTRALLLEWAKQGQAQAVRHALWSARISRLWESWRRAGRVIGDAVSRVIVGTLYFVLLPLYAVFARQGDPVRLGWQARSPAALPAARVAARRQY